MATTISPREKEWKVTIKTSDGTSSEVMVPAAPGKVPMSAEVQEIDVVSSEKKADPEKNDGKPKESPKVTRRVRAYLIVQHSLTAIFSAVIIAVMALTLQKHQSTQNVSGAWPPNAYLTPTLVLLAMAMITGAADIVMVIVDCLNGNAAKTAKLVASRIRTAGSILQTISSAGGAGFFKYAKNNSGDRDLWGWSCTNAAADYSSVTSAPSLCNSNEGAWVLSILQVVLQILSILIPLFALWKPGGKNDLNKNVEAAIKNHKKSEKTISGAEKEDYDDTGAGS